MDIKSLGTILGVWAHPDDETFCSAGIMAEAVKNEQRVVCITATKGEKGSLDETRWPSSTLAEVREKELSEALEILGVKEHEFLGLIDGECSKADKNELVQKISEIIKDVQPDTVLTFGPDGMTDHPDHKCISNWTTEALKKANLPNTTLLYATKTQKWKDDFLNEYQIYDAFNGDTPAVTPEAQLFINFSPTEVILDLKIAALKIQTSQTERFFDRSGEEFMRKSEGKEYFRKADF